MKEKFLISLVFLASFALAQDVEKLSQVEARLDSLGDYAGSTVIGKDDAPVAVSGDFTVRLKHFDYTKSSTLQEGERMRTHISSGLNALIVASPSSYLTVFSRFYLPFDFTGFYANEKAFVPNRENLGDTGERAPSFHESGDLYGAALNEDMLVGFDMRGGNFGATLLMGGVIWTSQSPLSMWERETNQRFISQYELYEEEKVVSTYYKEKGFKPVKEGGRAFWTNRSFGGILLDVHTLPWNLKGQVMFAQPVNADIGARDGLRLNSRDKTEMELTGTYDYRGMVIGGRFAKEKIDFAQASLTVGANYVGIDYDPGHIYESSFATNNFDPANTSVKFNNLHVASLDLKGNLTPKFFLAFDLAFSWDDTLSFRPKFSFDENSDCYEELQVESPTARCYNYKKYGTTTSTPSLGIYVKAQDKHLVPATLEFIYLPKDFYSPYSMSNPDRWPAWRKDQFYVGAGTFRYGPNMVGGNLKIEPEFNRGRFDFQYGIHKQVEEGADIINFKYNLVGRQLWETSSSWTRHKPFFNLDSGSAGGYVSRLAGIPQAPSQVKDRLNHQNGGLRSGYGETWDAFTPYASAQEAFYCAQANFYTDASACAMPTSTKWNSTVAVDMGYDIGHWFGTGRNIMLQLFTALSGVSSSFIPVAYTDKYDDDMLMWSLFVQSEPAVAITPNLHGVLILGFENFRAEKAYVALRDLTLGSTGISSGRTAYDALYAGGMQYYQLSPINILQTALGFGFDWDFAARAGLHFRYKYLTNNDENLPQNNWKAHHVQAETKVWF
ncbi:MAG: hypothetical protein LBU89_01210 [Fibromonadaceae bacterium]|jgi:hypothetical protein|nr:hypothetical protein [Fibromonadaceae bacterium]